MSGCRTTIKAGGGTPAEHAPATLIIDLDKIRNNYATLQGLCAGHEVGAVVKADGYGLGARQVAIALAQAGARTFFAAQLDEALAVRRVLDEQVPDCRVFVLNGLVAGAAGEYRAARLQPVLNSLGEIEDWSAFNRQRDLTLPAAVQVDTGMARLGLPDDELDALAAAPERFDGWEISLIMSHLACADTPAHPLNAEQLARFRGALARLPRARASLANSSGIFLGPGYLFDLARPGAALYGVNPTPAQPNPMSQVVRLQARILQVRQIDAPRSVGYGAAHRIEGPSRIATVGVGYADGYPRSLSGRATAWIEGREVPIVGRISMDLTTIDVSSTATEDVGVGGLVDLICPHGGVDRLASEAGTIGYEILTSLGCRYHRVYKSGDTS
jgi:alanine racemase